MDTNDGATFHLTLKSFFFIFMCNHHLSFQLAQDYVWTVFLLYKIWVSLIYFMLTDSWASLERGVLWVLFIAILFRALVHIICVFFFVFVSLKKPFSPLPSIAVFSLLNLLTL